MIVNDLQPAIATARSSRLSRRAPSVAAVATDLAVLSAVTVAAAVGRMRLPFFREVADVNDLAQLVGVPIVIGWILFIAAHGGYASHTLGAGTAEYKQVVRGTMVAAGVTGVLCYLAKFQFSRGFFFLLILIGIPSLLLGRLVLRRLLHAERRRGHLAHRVVVAGSGAQVDEVARVLNRESWLGYHVIGAVLPAEETTDQTEAGVPVLGSTARTAAVVADSDCDIVLFAGGAVTSAQAMRRAAWELADTPVQIMLVPGLTDVANDRVRVRPAAGLQLMELEGPRAHAATRISKRIFDVVGASALLVLFSPLMLATALAILLHDRGPVLFRQQRVGRNGDLFDLYKFRSMHVGADSVVDTVTTHNKHDDGHVLFKAAEDPRVTGPGRVIRRFSLDEMPQFLNVLRGEMSLVGPRPPLTGEVERYTADVRRRLDVRPGMTGLWQVSGRSDLSWEDSVRLDLYYVDNWSIVQDLVILARTMLVVLTARGAY